MHVINGFITPRSGSTNLDSNTPSITYSFDDGNPTPRIRGTGAAQTGAFSSNFSGYNIPNYHARVKRGELLPHTPWRTFRCEGTATGSYRFRTGTLSKWQEWFVLPVNCKNRDVWTVPESRCTEFIGNADAYVQEAAARIYSSGFDLLTFAAEIVTLRSMFENALRRALKLDFPKSIKRGANDWLEARYGWRTLLYDIKDINELIRQFNEKKLERLTEFAGGTNTETTIWSVVDSAESYYDFFLDYQDEVTIALRGGIVADISIPKIQANLAVTAWELIPFSFVVDWFISVGRSICALSFLALQREYSAFKGYKITVKRTLNGYSGAYTGTYLSGNRTHSSVCTGTLKVRTPCSVPYTPLSSLRLDVTKIIDLLALFVQRIRR